MKKLFVLSIFAVSQVHAQFDQKGEWHFPTSAKSYCANLEQNIVASFKSMVEQNRLASNPAWTGDKRQAFEVGAAIKNSIKESEESWHRMDCTSILYAKK